MGLEDEEERPFRKKMNNWSDSLFFVVVFLLSWHALLQKLRMLMRPTQYSSIQTAHSHSQCVEYGRLVSDPTLVVAPPAGSVLIRKLSGKVSIRGSAWVLLWLHYSAIVVVIWVPQEMIFPWYEQFVTQYLIYNQPFNSTEWIYHHLFRVRILWKLWQVDLNRWFSSLFFYLNIFSPVRPSSVAAVSHLRHEFKFIVRRCVLKAKVWSEIQSSHTGNKTWIQPKDNTFGDM